MKVNPEYFWYEMSEDEVEAICEVYSEENKSEWERARMIAYYSASGMSKLPKMTDFIPLPWDKESSIKSNKNRLKPSEERMKLIMKTINGD